MFRRPAARAERRLRRARSDARLDWLGYGATLEAGHAVPLRQAGEAVP